MNTIRRQTSFDGTALDGMLILLVEQVGFSDMVPLHEPGKHEGRASAAPSIHTSLRRT